MTGSARCGDGGPATCFLGAGPSLRCRHLSAFAGVLGLPRAESTPLEHKMGGRVWDGNGNREGRPASEAGLQQSSSVAMSDRVCVCGEDPPPLLKDGPPSVIHVEPGPDCGYFVAIGPGSRGMPPIA